MNNISIEAIKEIFENILEYQKESIRKIKSICKTDTIAPLDRLSEEIKHNNERLNTLSQETELKRT